MLVLICGDRNWTNRDAIKREMIQHGLDPAKDVVMHGCARGADSIAGSIAREHKFVVREYPANWTKYGKAAGPIRNQQMLDQNPDLVLAFHPNIEQSKGTGHMVRIARAKGVDVEVFAC